VGPQLYSFFVDRASPIGGVGLAKRLSVQLDGAERAARSNIRVHGDTAVVGLE
jgi:hypothetical protein